MTPLCEAHSNVAPQDVRSQDEVQRVVRSQAATRPGGCPRHARASHAQPVASRVHRYRGMTRSVGHPGRLPPPCQAQTSIEVRAKTGQSLPEPPRQEPLSPSRTWSLRHQRHVLHRRLPRWTRWSSPPDPPSADDRPLPGWSALSLLRSRRPVSSPLATCRVVRFGRRRDICRQRRRHIIQVGDHRSPEGALEGLPLQGTVETCAPPTQIRASSTVLLAPRHHHARRRHRGIQSQAKEPVLRSSATATDALSLRFTPAMCHGCAPHLLISQRRPSSSA